jgi:hypothetical protein
VIIIDREPSTAATQERASSSTGSPPVPQAEALSALLGAPEEARRGDPADVPLLLEAARAPPHGQNWRSIICLWSAAPEHAEHQTDDPQAVGKRLDAYET